MPHSLLAKARAGSMWDRGFGRILFMSSVAAFTGRIVGPHNAASKAGLHGLTHFLASRLAASSAQAIDWARERAKQVGAPVDFQCCSIFDVTFTEESYDLVPPELASKLQGYPGCGRSGDIR